MGRDYSLTWTPSTTFPLSVASNGKYLQKSDGTPFLMVGEAAWSLFTNLSLTDVATYLADRKAKGFNTLLVEFPEHKFCVNPAPQNIDGNTPFTTTGDFSTPRASFWSHVDSVMALCAPDFQVLVTGAYLGFGAGDEGWYANGMTSSGTTKMNGYGAFLAARYASYSNISWVIGGDYTPPESAIISAFFAGLRSAGPTRLSTAHWNGSGGDYYSSTLYADSPNPHWDIQGVYSWNSEVSAELAGAGTGKPIVLTETHYDNYSGVAAQLVRGAAWASFLWGPSGQCGCGHIYGDENVWPFGVSPSPFGTSSAWASNLNSPGAKNMSTLATVLGALGAPAGFSPDTAAAWITSGGGTAGSAGFIPRAASSDARKFVAYVPDARNSFVLAKSQFAAAVDLDWIDPGSGAVTNISTGTANTGTTTLSRATANSLGDHDYILRGVAP